MALTRVLIAVKTYPTLSEKYDELVCTAGFREDGTWVRIYPIPFRKLNYKIQYHKWQWIKIDIVKNTSDFRSESFRPYSIDQELFIEEKIGTENNWIKRKEIVLKNVHTNMADLIAQAKDTTISTSLAVFKPKEIKNFIWENDSRDWNKKTLEKVYSNQKQKKLFDDVNSTKNIFTVVKKLPFKFSYIFTSDDGIERTMMIEDWELGMLYWKCLDKYHDEQEACKKVKEKYFSMITKCDLYFFYGNHKAISQCRT